MRPQNLLRFLLILPYLAVGLAILAIEATHGMPRDDTFLDNILGMLGLLAEFYFVAIFFWGIPYSILAIGLVIWSINKHERLIFRVFFFSPFLLMILMELEILFLPIWVGYVPSFNDLSKMLYAWSFYDLLSLFWFFGLAAIPSIVFGYLFVGIGAAIYQSFEILRLVKSHNEPSSVQHDAPNTGCT